MSRQVVLDPVEQVSGDEGVNGLYKAELLHARPA